MGRAKTKETNDMDLVLLRENAIREVPIQLSFLRGKGAGGACDLGQGVLPHLCLLRGPVIMGDRSGTMEGGGGGCGRHLVDRVHVLAMRG